MFVVGRIGTPRDAAAGLAFDAVLDANITFAWDVQSVGQGDPPALLP
jgi:hypothetical protein